jgi:hypothetical protein
VLSTLTIDGRNYFNGGKRDGVGWRHAVQNVSDLTVSRYTPRPGESFSTDAFLLHLGDMKQLDYLRIVDIDLCPSPSEPHTSTTPFQILKHLERLYVHDMAKFEPVSEVLNLMDSMYLTMVQCALGQPVRHFWPSGYLSLEDIDETQDMIVFLNMWEGGRLFVTSCPGFNDRVLDLISTSTSIYQLVIVDCPNFSVEALKRMVSGLVYQNGQWRKLELLRVSGRLPP